MFKKEITFIGLPEYVSEAYSLFEKRTDIDLGTGQKTNLTADLSKAGRTLTLKAESGDRINPFLFYAAVRDILRIHDNNCAGNNLNKHLCKVMN